MQISQRNHFVVGIAPVADFMAGTVYTDVINMKNYAHVAFLILKGIGATGTSTITVEANDSNSTSGGTAIPFKYKICTATDVWGETKSATVAGFALTAGSGQMYAIEVDAAAMPPNGEYLYMKGVEVVNSPVTGGILIEMSEPSFAEDTIATALV